MKIYGLRIIPFIILISIIKSCGINDVLKEQKSFISDIRLSETNEKIVLNETIFVSVKRGVLNETYSCFISSQVLNKIWESNLGYFYIQNNKDMNCEESDIGGIFWLTKTDEYFIWTYPRGFNSKEITIQNLYNPKKIESFKSFSSVKPFVHKAYKVNKSIIKNL